MGNLENYPYNTLTNTLYKTPHRSLEFKKPYTLNPKP